MPAKVFERLGNGVSIMQAGICVIAMGLEQSLKLIQVMIVFGLLGQRDQRRPDAVQAWIALHRRQIGRFRRFKPPEKLQGRT